MKRKADRAPHMTAGILHGRPSENPYKTNLEAMYAMLHELPDFSFSPAGSSSARGSLSAGNSSHMFVLAAFSGLWRNLLGTGGEGALGVWTTPVEIVLTASCAFICVAAVSVAGRKIPKVGKFIFG